jgi:hypothetical protein
MRRHPGGYTTTSRFPLFNASIIGPDSNNPQATLDMIGAEMLKLCRHMDALKNSVTRLAGRIESLPPNRSHRSTVTALICAQINAWRCLKKASARPHRAV